MDRVKIKQKAREKMKGNLWELWKPLIIFTLITACLGLLFDKNNEYNSATFIFDIVLFPLSIGVIGYYLNFIRGKKFEIGEIWNYYKNFLKIILIYLLVGLVVVGGTILLIIPGIIFALAYSMTSPLIADGHTEGIDTMKLSREMMHGYKWDYFVFQLSFILWILLIPLTFGIAAIYVVPYVFLSQSIYYEELRKKCKIKA